MTTSTARSSAMFLDKHWTIRFAIALSISLTLFGGLAALARRGEAGEPSAQASASNRFAAQQFVHWSALQIRISKFDGGKIPATQEERLALLPAMDEMETQARTMQTEIAAKRSSLEAKQLHFANAVDAVATANLAYLTDYEHLVVEERFHEVNDAGLPTLEAADFDRAALLWRTVLLKTIDMLPAAVGAGLLRPEEAQVMESRLRACICLQDEAAAPPSTVSS